MYLRHISRMVVRHEPPSRSRLFQESPSLKSIARLRWSRSNRTKAKESNHGTQLEMDPPIVHGQPRRAHSGNVESQEAALLFLSDTRFKDHRVRFDRKRV